MKTENLFKEMNLQEVLQKMRISSFILAEKKYYSVHRDMIENITSPIYDELNINDNEIGSRLALICEYYLKGLLLPVMKVEASENDSELELVVQNLTDIEKYKLIIGDDDTITSLSNKYKMPKKRIKKIVEGGTLKDLGHNLNKLAKLIHDKAEKGAFEGKSNYIKESIELVIEDSEDFNVKNAFADGRYAYLDEYLANVKKLRKITDKLRFISAYLEKGIKIQLKSSTEYIFDDERIYYFDNPKKIVVLNENLEETRGYICAKNGIILPEFGIENERKTEQGLFKPAYGHFFELQEAKMQYVQFDNNIVVNPGDTIGIMSEGGEWTTIYSRNGQLKFTDRAEIFKYRNLYDTKLDKAKKETDKRITREVLLGKPSRLTLKYARYAIADEQLKKIREIRAFYGTNRNSETVKKRPTSKEFRQAYMEYTKSDLSFRFERGRQIFKSMINIIRGKKKDDREESR